MSYLEFYYKCAKAKKLPDWGLCLSGDRNDRVWMRFLHIVSPTDVNFMHLNNDGYCLIYWGSGMMTSVDRDVRKYSFTPLRQNLLLLICCLNNEL